MTGRRYDTQGIDITELPGLWDEADCEITTTQYIHPDSIAGMHTNGPWSTWIRLPDGGVGWLQSPFLSRYETLETWKGGGIQFFQNSPEK